MRARPHPTHLTRSPLLRRPLCSTTSPSSRHPRPSWSGRRQTLAARPSPPPRPSRARRQRHRTAGSQSPWLSRRASPRHPHPQRGPLRLRMRARCLCHLPHSHQPARQPTRRLRRQRTASCPSPRCPRLGPRARLPPQVQLLRWRRLRCPQIQRRPRPAALLRRHVSRSRHSLAQACVAITSSCTSLSLCPFFTLPTTCQHMQPSLPLP